MTSGKTCIVHYTKFSGDVQVRSLTEHSFSTIRNSVKIRQQHTSTSVRLDSICSQVPEEFDDLLHGCHRWCYTNFTNVSKFSAAGDDANMDNGDVSSSSAATRKSGRSAGATAVTEGNSSLGLFPRDQCIFCSSKGRKKVKGNLEKLSTCVTETAEMSIKQAAEAKSDFSVLGKVAGIDLRAREARYHESCRKAYVRDDSREHHKSSNRTDTTEDECSSGQQKLQEAHMKAFSSICTYIESSLIADGNVERMTMIRDKYVTFVQGHIPGYSTDQFRTARMKERLVNHFGNRIKFWLPSRRCTSELVYAADLDTGEAVQTAYESAASDNHILADAAAILRRNIQATYNNSHTSPWPPSASYLQFDATKPPSSLVDFLAQLISGTSAENSSDKTQRLCGSFAEDICSATTRGRWNVPKHQLLGVTLHHLTGKADIVTMLHRYGHCSSYTAVLELETAIANQVQDQDAVLPSNITATDNNVIHVCWDNCDLNEETPSGAATTHTTHGIVIQQVSCSTEHSVSVAANTCTHPSKPKSRPRSFKPITDGPLPYARKSNAEPSILNVTSTAGAGDGETVSTCGLSDSEGLQTLDNMKGQLWTLCRAMYNSNWTVPDWSGWLSKTFGQADNVTLSRIGYMKPIMHPITDCATVKKCLTTSMEVTRKLNQEYTLVTMDLAAAKLAYDLIWGDQEQFAKVIVNLGPFHTTCSYLGAIGKMMSGSGFEDIVVEAGLCASGSIEQVMSGKHYNRSMRVHQRMLDALDRMMMTSFQQYAQSSPERNCLPAVVTLAEEPSAAHLQAAEDSAACKAFLADFNSFKEAIRHGDFGKTAQFWMQYCDCVWTVLTFQRAVKENDLDLFIKSMTQMCGLLLSADHLNYGKYLPFYCVQLRNLQETHPGAEVLLSTCGFSVARSTTPGCRLPIDQTIEQTINRSAKTSGGIIGFSRNVGAYHRWCLTRHERATFAEATLDHLDMKEDTMDAHKSTRTSSVKRSEMEVQRVMNTFDHFVNPFSTNQDQQQLFCLSSGQPALEDVADDLLKYVDAGNRAASDFVQSRLLSCTAKFHDRMKKMSLKTFQAMAVKCTMSCSKKKAVEVKAERNLLGRLVLLSQHREISLEHLFEYPLGPIPWALATADGALVKTNKAQLMHCIEDLIVKHATSMPENAVHIVDGNALLQGLVHLPETFEDLASTIFNILPKVATVHFVTDTYVDNSVKDLERLRRGSSPTYLVGGRKTRLPRNFKSFMHNAENKRQLTKFLLAEWQSDRYASRIHHRTVFFVCEKECLCLQSEDGLTVTASPAVDLSSDHEEADTRIILHCLYASHHSAPSSAIVVHSPDTDVFVLLLHYSHRIQQPLMFYTGSGNNRRIILVHKCANELDSDICAALPSFHAFTGCDTISAFVRKGKKGPLKQLRNNNAALEAFKNIGTTADIVSDSTLEEMEKFVCLMYGKSRYSDVNKLRYETFKTRYEVRAQERNVIMYNGVDISLLPPCRASLRKHCQRVNYQSYMWKNAHIAQLQLPSPIGCGWRMDAEGKLTVDWIEDALPQQLVEEMSQDASAEKPQTETDEYIEEFEVGNIIDAVFDDDDDDDVDEDKCTGLSG